jgi:hypothetical protein
LIRCSHSLWNNKKHIFTCHRWPEKSPNADDRYRFTANSFTRRFDWLVIINRTLHTCQNIIALNFAVNNLLGIQLLPNTPCC